MVRPGSGEQERLGFGRPAFDLSLQQERADRLGTGAAAGLAGLDDIEAARTQRRRQGLQLGGLADPFPAFEGDEAAGHAWPKRDFTPSQMRPKKPASPIAVSATSGVVCSGMSPAWTTRSAMCWPCAIGACTGP